MTPEAKTPLSTQSESESHSVMSDSLQPHGLYSSWNFPGQNIGMGSLSLLTELWGKPYLASFDSKASTSSVTCPCVSLGCTDHTPVSLCGLRLFSPWRIPGGEVNDCPKCREESYLKIEDSPARLVWDQFLNRAWSVTFIRKTSKTGLESAVPEAGKSRSQWLSFAWCPEACQTAPELLSICILHSRWADPTGYVSWKASNKRPCDAVVDKPGLPSQPCLWPEGQEDLLQFCESMRREKEGSNVMTRVYHTTPSLPTHSCKYIQQPFCKQPMCPTREDWVNKSTSIRWDIVQPLKMMLTMFRVEH